MGQPRVSKFCSNDHVRIVPGCVVVAWAQREHFAEDVISHRLASPTDPTRVLRLVPTKNRVYVSGSASASNSQMCPEVSRVTSRVRIGRWIRFFRMSRLLWRSRIALAAHRLRTQRLQKRRGLVNTQDSLLFQFWSCSQAWGSFVCFFGLLDVAFLSELCLRCYSQVTRFESGMSKLKHDRICLEWCRVLNLIVDHMWGNRLLHLKKQILTNHNTLLRWQVMMTYYRRVLCLRACALEQRRKKKQHHEDSWLVLVRRLVHVDDKRSCYRYARYHVLCRQQSVARWTLIFCSLYRKLCFTGQNAEYTQCL